MWTTGSCSTSGWTRFSSTSIVRPICEFSPSNAQALKAMSEDISKTKIMIIITKLLISWRSSWSLWRSCWSSWRSSWSQDARQHGVRPAFPALSSASGRVKESVSAIVFALSSLLSPPLPSPLSSPLSSRLPLHQNQGDDNDYPRSAHNSGSTPEVGASPLPPPRKLGPSLSR